MARRFQLFILWTLIVLLIILIPVNVIIDIVNVPIEIKRFGYGLVLELFESKQMMWVNIAAITTGSAIFVPLLWQDIRQLNEEKARFTKLRMMLEVELFENIRCLIVDDLELFASFSVMSTLKQTPDALKDIVIFEDFVDVYNKMAVYENIVKFSPARANYLAINSAKYNALNYIINSPLFASLFPDKAKETKALTAINKQSEDLDLWDKSARNFIAQFRTAKDQTSGQFVDSLKVKLQNISVKTETTDDYINSLCEQAKFLALHFSSEFESWVQSQAASGKSGWGGFKDHCDKEHVKYKDKFINEIGIHFFEDMIMKLKNDAYSALRKRISTLITDKSSEIKATIVMNTKKMIP